MLHKTSSQLQHFFNIISILTNLIWNYEVAFEVSSTCNQAGYHVALEYNCTYMGQVGGLRSHCYMECKQGTVIHSISPSKSALRLRRGIQINWIEKQKLLVRKKRGYAPTFTDPEWKNMWYLNRQSYGHPLVDHNVTAAWNMGYTGRGVTITFLDDGLEHSHPDLIANYDPKASIDINSNDDDPTPRYEPSHQNKHGTRCAGEVVASANNSICIVGVAYDAKVGGIRMLDGDVSDRVEAASLSFRNNHIDIYSASWGPDDNGKVVDGPGRLTQRAFEDGAYYGRGGKGSIFVWANGNGGKDSDSCACDGYINSIYTFAIGATTERGTKPWYQEECAGTIASTFSSGDPSRGDRSVLTTDINHGCTSFHTGTSAAAPLATAFIALVLQARPDLTWRDVMYIIVLGSRYDAIHDESQYRVNAAGYRVSNKYGFGLMDAGLMVHLALKWIKVEPMVSCESQTILENKDIGPTSTYVSELKLSSSTCFPNVVGFIEQVQVLVKIKCKRRGTLKLYVISPSGTESLILPVRSEDRKEGEFNSWPFLTLHFWGEKSIGTWQLRVINTKEQTSKLISWSVIIHGTQADISAMDDGVAENKKKARSPNSAKHMEPMKCLLLFTSVMLILMYIQ